MLRLISFGSAPLCPPAVRSVSRCDRGSDPMCPPDVRSVCRCDRGSDPPVPELALQGVRPAVASRASLGGTSGLTPFRPPAVRSICRCDRGSDPSVPELATEGLTHCRAPLHEPPALHSSDPKPPFRRSASSFPSLRRLLSVAVPPPFRRFRGSDPLLPAELRSVAHRVRPLSAPLLSVLVAGATEGLTHCRAPLHESPSPHRSERSPLSTFPAQKRTKPLEAPLNHPRP